MEEVGYEAPHYKLRDSRDLLQKLRWEINNFINRERHDVQGCAFHLFNAAATASHLSDWTWDHLKTDDKTLYRIRRTEFVCLGNHEDFKNFAESRCPEVRLCRQIANGSKHVEFRGKTGAHVSDGEGYEYGNPIMAHGTNERLATDVLYLVLFWYEEFLRRWELFPEEPIGLGIPQPPSPTVQA